jgi:hypothetical protein
LLDCRKFLVCSTLQSYNKLIFFSQRRHSSGSSLLEALDDEETKKLSECLEKILDVVGESMPEVLGNIFEHPTG